MKNLNKKIGAIVLAGMILSGVSLSHQSIISYADSGKHRCEHVKESMNKSYGSKDLDNYYDEFNDSVLMDNQNRYKYEVWGGKRSGDLKLSNSEDAKKKRYYSDIFDFIDCINQDGHRPPEGFICCVIGNNSYIIYFNSIS